MSEARASLLAALQQSRGEGDGDAIIMALAEVLLGMEAHVITTLRDVDLRLARIERDLDTITQQGARTMSAIDDLKAELQGFSDESDSILTGIQALEAAQASGSQTAVDAAIADIKASADAAKVHVDAAFAALPAVAPAPVPTPPAPTPPTGA